MKKLLSITPKLTTFIHNSQMHTITEDVPKASLVQYREAIKEFDKKL